MEAEKPQANGEGGATTGETPVLHTGAGRYAPLARGRALAGGQVLALRDRWLGRRWSVSWQKGSEKWHWVPPEYPGDFLLDFVDEIRLPRKWREVFRSNFVTRTGSSIATRFDSAGGYRRGDFASAYQLTTFTA